MKKLTFLVAFLMVSTSGLLGSRAWAGQLIESISGKYVLEYSFKKNNELQFELRDLFDKTVTGFTSEPTVKLWMPRPDMNHGSSPTKTQALGSGQYNTTDIDYLMNGIWELRIEFQVANEKAKDFAIIVVRVKK